MGHSFLKSAFTPDYNDGNTTYKLFVIKGVDAKDWEEMLRQYVQLTGSVQEDLREARYALPDPYHGDAALSWKGKYIWGVLNLEEENIRIRYLKLMEELLGIRDQF